jgi:integrase
VASITKHGSGWRAQIDKRGVRLSKVHATKAAAQAWATAEEAKILAGEGRRWPDKTLGDAVDRYMREVSPTKKGERAEVLRLEKFKRENSQICERQISEVRTPDLVAWRQARLREVTAGSVRRDANILRNLFRVAVEEWQWLGESPFRGFKVPSDNPPRDRRVKPSEVLQICRWFGFRWGKVTTKHQEIALALLVALRTGMRAGEILSLRPSMVDLEKRTATVSHKTQHITGKPRKIPLTRQGVRLLRMVAHRDPMFTLKPDSMSAMFYKATRAMGIEGLTFHDSRAEALTRLARKVDPITLARISGHRDLKMILNVYYRESAEDIAARL